MAAPHGKRGMNRVRCEELSFIITIAWFRKFWSLGSFMYGGCENRLIGLLPENS